MKRMLRSAICALGLLFVLGIAQTASAAPNNTASQTDYPAVSADKLKATFSSTKAPYNTSQVSTGTTALTSRVGRCVILTGTTTLSAPAGKILSYKSEAIRCSTRRRVTRFYWLPPSWNITAKGILGGWHYKGHRSSTRITSRRLRTGSDVGRFRQYYEGCIIKCVTVSISSHNVVHNLWVTPRNYGWF